MAAIRCQQQLVLLTLYFVTHASARISATGGGRGTREHSLTLRAGSSAAPSAAPAGAPSASPSAAPADDSLGQFDCVFNGPCTCDGAAKYLDCINDHCSLPNYNCSSLQFSQSCGALSSVCASTLDLHCSPKKSKCEGKYHQAADGLIGLLIDFESLESKAYCGPFGKCTGEVDVAVNIHRLEPGVRLQCLMEDSAGDERARLDLLALSNSTQAEGKKKESTKDKAAEEKKANTTKAKSAEEKTNKTKSETNATKPPAANSADEAGDDDIHLKGCSARVTGDTAGCTLSMPPKLEPGSKIEGLCRLVDDHTDKVLTKDAWFTIKNSAKKIQVEKSKKEEKPDVEAKGGSEAVAKPWVALAVATSIAAAMH